MLPTINPAMEKPLWQISSAIRFSWQWIRWLICFVLFWLCFCFVLLYIALPLQPTLAHPKSLVMSLETLWAWVYICNYPLTIYLEQLWAWETSLGQWKSLHTGHCCSPSKELAVPESILAPVSSVLLWVRCWSLSRVPMVKGFSTTSTKYRELPRAVNKPKHSELQKIISPKILS